jgi:hypothetical protein
MRISRLLAAGMTETNRDWYAAGSRKWLPLRQCTPQERRCSARLMEQVLTYPQFLFPVRDEEGFNCPIATRSKLVGAEPGRTLAMGVATSPHTIWLRRVREVWR